MDISRQVFRRSAKMGLMYVILSVALGSILTVVFDSAGRVGTVTSNGTTVNLATYLGALVVPFGALVGLIIATPVFFLFVYDKNAGVLEYLLAVGMGQRDIFKGYLTGALMLSIVAMMPVVLLNLALSPGGPVFAALTDLGAVATGFADVALVTVLMTAFSSMQRRPSGMNSPLGMGIGALILVPELILGTSLGPILGGSVFWIYVAFAVGVICISGLLLLSIDKLILREKFLP